MRDTAPGDDVMIRVTDSSGHDWHLQVSGPRGRSIEQLLDLINASVEEWIRD